MKCEITERCIEFDCLIRLSFCLFTEHLKRLIHLASLFSFRLNVYRRKATCAIATHLLQVHIITIHLMMVLVEVGNNLADFCQELHIVRFLLAERHGMLCMYTSCIKLHSNHSRTLSRKCTSATCSLSHGWKNACLILLKSTSTFSPFCVVYRNPFK